MRLEVLLASDPGDPDLRSASHFLKWLAVAQWQGLIVGAFYGILWMGSLAGLPLLLGAAVEAATLRNPGQVLIWSAALLALSLLGALAGVMRHRRAVFNYLTASSRVQRLIIRAAARLGADLPLHVAAGEVASLSATDVDRIGQAFDTTGRFAGAVISYLGVAAVLFAFSPAFGLVAVVGGPLTMLALVVCLRPLGRRQTAQREAIAVASGLAVDVVAGLRIVRGLGGEPVFAQRFGAAAQRVGAAMARTAQMTAVLAALEVLIPGALLVAVTWIGASLAESGRFSPGQLVTVYAFAAFLLVPLATFGEAVQRWSAAAVAARRVLTVLARQRDLAEVEAPPSGRRFSPEELARGELEDSTTGVRIQPGQLTAITAPTPEELSELGSRLGRFSDPVEGEQVSINGVRLSSLPLATVREAILVVDRDAAVLAGTVLEAVDPPSPGRGSRSRPSVTAALRAAAAGEVVHGLEGGLQHLLPERGRSLSGGQRQRLVLARALRADPAILVLEEPTSAVDAHTEAEIAESLAACRRGRTTVVLTSSPLILERADRVIAINGRVVAEGTHQELFANSPWYRRQLQLEAPA